MDACNLGNERISGVHDGILVQLLGKSRRWRNPLKMAPFFSFYFSLNSNHERTKFEKKNCEPSPCDQTFVVLENDVIASLSRDMYITIWHWIWNRQDWAGTVQQLRERDPPCLSWRQRKKEQKKNNTHIPDVFVCCCCCTVGKCSNLPPPPFSLFSCLHWVLSARRTHTHSVRRKLRNNKKKKNETFICYLSFALTTRPKWWNTSRFPTPLSFFFKFILQIP